MRNIVSPLLLGSLMLSGCMTTAATVSSAPTLDLTADAETVPVGTVNRDAADDPAIWRNAADPAKSLIIGTDKRAGLYVYGLDGSKKSFLPEGELNNVDLREVMIGGEKTVLVGASIRNDPANAHVGLYKLDTATAELSLLGKYPAGPGEAYGFCFGQDSGGETFAYMIEKSGFVREITLSFEGSTPSATITREYKLATQPEGCVVDDAAETIFIGEEEHGIWKLNPADGSEPVIVDTIAAGNGLVADVEGLSLWLGEGGQGYLVASAQAADRFVVYDRAAPHAPRGVFTVTGSADGSIDAVSHTDGLDASSAALPGFPRGVLIVQDDANPVPEVDQNFKVVDWQAVEAALGLTE